MNELDMLLQNRPATEDFAYWVVVAGQFLKRYDIELGINNAYGGHLAILLEAAYKKGKDCDSKVARFEVIDHTADSEESRALVKYGVSIELDYQDEGRTLKAFLKDRDRPATVGEQVAYMTSMDIDPAFAEYIADINRHFEAVPVEAIPKGEVALTIKEMLVPVKGIASRTNNETLISLASKLDVNLKANRRKDGDDEQK